MRLEICVTIFASLATISFIRLLIMIHKYKHVALCKALEINGNSVSVNILMQVRRLVIEMVILEKLSTQISII